LTPRYLLDTNILSEPIKSTPNARVLKSIAAREGQLATCAVVWHELRFGCERLPASRRKRTIVEYLSDVVRPNIPILPYDEEAAAWHARERSRLSRRGVQPAAADGQIAAIAYVNELVLVTANVRDYRHFDELRIEDWS